MHVPLVCAVDPEYVPAGQSVQTEAPAAEYLPAAQLVQTSLVCAVDPEYVPAGQSVQTEAPAAEYLPAVQLLQSVAFVFPSEPEYVPAGQLLQPVAASEPENLPAGHAEQEREAEIEYFPFSHAVQSSVFMPPARSLHSLRVSLTRQVTK